MFRMVKVYRCVDEGWKLQNHRVTMVKAKLDGEWEIVRKTHRLIDAGLTELGPFVALAEASRKIDMALQSLCGC